MKKTSKGKAMKGRRRRNGEGKNKYDLVDVKGKGQSREKTVPSKARRNGWKIPSFDVTSFFFPSFDVSFFSSSFFVAKTLPAGFEPYIRRGQPVSASIRAKRCLDRSAANFAYLYSSFVDFPFDVFFFSLLCL